MKELSYDQALLRAASLCSSGEHNSNEVLEKLLRWGLEEEKAQQAIQYLQEEGYIDNERYARAYCHDKLRYNRWGRQKMQQMLRLAGLTPAEIRQGIDALSPEEYQSALKEAAHQKLRSLHEKDAYTLRGKLIRHLLSRGFLMNEILDALDSEIPDSEPFAD